MEIKNPSFNYDQLGHCYSTYRQTDLRIAAYVEKALGSAKTVLNVGAGSGSYEPEDRYVLAVEPSVTMRAQRKSGRVPALIGKADALPFDDHSFDAVMAMITLHHWPDLIKGLMELKRVAREKVIIMTCDPDALTGYWSAEYFPELLEVERKRFPKIETITQVLGGTSEVEKIAIPSDCVDGFIEAFYARPEALLDKDIRRSQSSWDFLDKGMEEVLVKRLSDDLASGGWDKKYGAHRCMPYFEGSLTLIVTKII